MTGVLFFLVLFSPIPVQADFETIAVPMTLEYDLRIPKHRLPLFSKVVMATAWQESCFRPFVVKNDEITYLRSYNQTSVGIMQINERVWRGIYDLQKLRNACPAG